MKGVLFVLLALFLSLCSTSRLGRRNKERHEKNDVYVRFQLLKHMPCPHNTRISKWQQKIRFPADTENPLRRSRKGCYKFGGELEVFEPLRKGTPLQMYIEVTDEPKSKKAQEQCYDVGTDGCGGVGSCVYCDTCNVHIAADQSNLGDQFTRFRDRRTRTCQKGFEKGRNQNIFVEFCFPTLKRFFESKQLNPDIWQDIVERGKNLKKIALFMKVRFYNSEINKQFKHAQVYETFMRGNMRINNGEALPKRRLMRIPFYRSMEKNMIGCHILQGNLFLENK